MNLKKKKKIMSQKEEVTSLFQSCQGALFSLIRRIHMRADDIMNGGNDSVVICDTPSPAKNNTGLINTVMINDYRKRLRSNGVKSLLSSVYESPLLHFKRNKMPETAMNEDANEIMFVRSPPMKKRKKRLATKAAARLLRDIDESVIILNDTVMSDEAEPVIEVGFSDTETNDVVEVPETRVSLEPDEIAISLKSRRREARSAKPLRAKLADRKKKKAKRKVLNLKNPRNLKLAKAAVEALSVNDENHNGQIMEREPGECSSSVSDDAEEVEVVWVSRTEPTSRGVTSVDRPFVVDTSPSLTNLVNAINIKDSRKQRKQTRSNTKGSRKLAHGGARKPQRGSAKSDQQVEKPDSGPRKLREIVIDGLNVGMGHTYGNTFSEAGLNLVIDYFKTRGHVVKAFLPQKMRTRNRVLLERLHREGTLVFTPSRVIAGKMITPYDDRFILDYATQCDGIVISSDQYRDLWLEKPQWRNTIEKRLLAPTFVGDYIMFPEDPLGRSGPKLEEFLRH